MFYQRNLLALLVTGAFLGLSATSANAITSSFVFSNPTVFSGVGSLDVASNLPSGNVATFTSGSLDFSFSALAFSPAYVSNYTTPYAYSGYSPNYTGTWCGRYGCYPIFNGYSYYYYNSSTDYYSTPQASATVKVGENTATVAAPSATTNVFTGSTTTSSANGSDTYYYTTSFYQDTTTIGGNFHVILGSDPTALGALNNTGLVGFNFQHLGNVTLNQVTLTADYTLAPVPEPETYAMLLAGLGLVGFTARRRSKFAS